MENFRQIIRNKFQSFGICLPISVKSQEKGGCYIYRKKKSKISVGNFRSKRKCFILSFRQNLLLRLKFEFCMVILKGNRETLIISFQDILNSWKTGLPFQKFRSSRKFSGGTRVKESYFIYIPIEISSFFENDYNHGQYFLSILCSAYYHTVCNVWRKSC